MGESSFATAVSKLQPWPEQEHGIFKNLKETLVFCFCFVYFFQLIQINKLHIPFIEKS